MKNNRGSVIPAVAFMFAAAVLVAILAWRFWPKDEEIASNSSLDTNKVVNSSGSNANAATNTNAAANTNASASTVATYSNTATGLSFQYPSSRITREYKNNFEVRVMDANDSGRDDARLTGAVAGPGDTEIAELATYYSDPKQYLINTFTLRAEIQKTTVAGETAYSVTYSQPLDSQEDDLLLYTFNHTGKTWFVRQEYHGKTASADKAFADFVKSISFAKISATADWKTYTNAQNGFSMKYPSDTTLTTSSSNPLAVIKTSSTEVTTAKHITLRVENHSLNASAIVGSFGQVVTGATSTNVGSQTAYQFSEGNAGCGGTAVATALGSTKTLYICLPAPQAVGDYNVWYSDLTARTDLLGAFTFTK